MDCASKISEFDLYRQIKLGDPYVPVICGRAHFHRGSSAYLQGLCLFKALKVTMESSFLHGVAPLLKVRVLEAGPPTRPSFV